jgi:hypothetical protein
VQAVPILNEMGLLSEEIARSAMPNATSVAFAVRH